MQKGCPREENEGQLIKRCIGTLFLKHILKETDKDIIELIKENLYLQCFFSFKEYSYDQSFTPSLFVSISRRLGEGGFLELSDLFIEHVHKVEERIREKKQYPEGKWKSSPDSTKEEEKTDEAKITNKGQLIVDATVAPSDIKYPTDLDLLNEAREKSELLIDLLSEPAPGKVKTRTYRKKARKEYLAATEQRKKQKKTIPNKSIKKQLNYLKRNLQTIEKLLDEKGSGSFSLDYKFQRIYFIIQEVYCQQKQMYDEKRHKIEGRLVSISQPYIRPIVRGKSGK